MAIHRLVDNHAKWFDFVDRTRPIVRWLDFRYPIYWSLVGGFALGSRIALFDWNWMVRGDYHLWIPIIGLFDCHRETSGCLRRDLAIGRLHISASLDLGPVRFSCTISRHDRRWDALSGIDVRGFGCPGIFRRWFVHKFVSA